MFAPSLRNHQVQFTIRLSSTWVQPKIGTAVNLPVSTYAKERNEQKKVLMVNSDAS